jgi:hypothetical protein
MPAGTTFSVPGAAPKLHNVIAPLVTTTATTANVPTRPEVREPDFRAPDAARRGNGAPNRARLLPEVLSRRRFHPW